MTLSPGSKLGPYEILSSIGSGGMGEVWKARDSRLGRIVAIKKVKEQHSERFKQEARSIAALNHPNICQIFDIGDDYLVLEYVEGKPLSSPLPEQEAVKLAIQIATALEAAHKKGIIHRDLKPGNIMVSDEGTVKLLDFGLAKLYEQDQSTSNLPTESVPATQAGAVLGTVAYMSPEQAQGKPVDVRSDIFSFGLVLYEMLSGQRAFLGDSAPETMAALLRDEPPPLQTSPALEKIVKRCLEKKPSDRFQSMSEVKAALEKVIKPKVAVSSEERPPSIAVLPFVNMSGDKEQEYFSDGLAEEIINALTKIPGLMVIARTSAFAFKGKQEDIRKIAEMLDVDNILEGSVRKSGSRIRVTAQLIEASKGSHLWSERYDRELTNVFEIQDEICQAIVDKLRVHLSEDRPLVKRYTEKIEAYNLYLRARYHLFKFTMESLPKSKGYLEQAIAMDPNYPRAWHGLALYYWWLGYLGFMAPKETNVQCNQAITKALKLDEMMAEAHSLMAILHTSEFSWKEAESEFRRALELDPKSADVWANYSQFYLAPMRRLDEAVAASQKALELDPLSPHLQFHLGQRYWIMRQYDRAIEQFRNALDLDAQWYWAHALLGLTNMQKGKFDEGIQAVETAEKLVGQNPLILGMVGWAYALAGQIDEAQRLLDKLQEFAKQTYVSSVAFMWIHSGLGEIDRALYWAKKAVDERDSMMHMASVAPMPDQMRSHPHFQDLLRKMNLEP